MSEQVDVQEFLKEANVAVLATVDGQGRPHAAPIWYLYEDGIFVMSTGRGSQKHRNIERNQHVTLVADRRTLPYFAAMVSGRAEIGPPLSDAKRLELATRYLGGEMGRAYVARTEAGSSVTIRLRPEKVIEFNGQAGRD